MHNHQLEYDHHDGHDQLEYDHHSNSDLELLGASDADPDDLFTFNNHEIYITDPHDREFNEDFVLDDNLVSLSTFSFYYY